MSRLGNIFKKKLDQRQFEFRKDYWNDLEKQLDSHFYTGRKKFNYWKWILSSLGLAVITAAAVWIFNRPEEENNLAEASLKENTIEKNGSTSKQRLEQTPEPFSNYTKDEHANHSAKQHSVTVNSSSTLQEERTAKEELKNIAQPLKNQHNAEKDKTTKNALAENSPAENEPKKSTNVVTDPPRMENALTTLYRENASQDFTGPKLKEDGRTTETTTGSKTAEKSVKNPATAENENNSPLIKEYSLAFNVPPQAAEKISPETLFAEKEKNTSSQNLREETNRPLMMMKKIAPPEFPAKLNTTLNTAATTTLKEENTFPGKKKNYFVGLYSGLMYSAKILKSKDQTLNEFIARRKAEEQPALSGYFGLDAGMSINRWNVTSGINYHYQSEIIDYKPEFYQWIKSTITNWNVTDNSYWKTDTVNTFSITVAEGHWEDSQVMTSDSQMTIVNIYVTDTTYQKYFYDTATTFIEDIDSTATVHTDSSNQLISDASLKPQKTVSKISYVEIPLLIGYEVPMNRFSILLRTGLSVGILSKYQAVYLKNDISGIETADVTKVNKTVWNFLLRAGAGYHLNEKLSFSLEPVFRMNLNSAVKNTGYSQKYWNAALNAGVMWRF